MSTIDDSTPGSRRLWRYQRERILLPVLGPVAALAGASAVSLTGLIAGEKPGAGVLIVVCLSVFGLIVLRRILHDIAQYRDDIAHHPRSAVARGLVSRRQLIGVAGGVVLTLAIVNLVAYPAALGHLAAALVGIAASAAAAAALGTAADRPRVGLIALVRAVAYLAIGVYAAAPRWLQDPADSYGVWALMAYTFVAGLAWELGRDLRGPHDVAPGEAVVSQAWGPLLATIVWFVVLMAAGSLAATVAFYLPSTWAVALGIDATLVVAAVIGMAYVRSPSLRRGAVLAGFTAGWAVGVPAVLAAQAAFL